MYNIFFDLGVKLTMFHGTTILSVRRGTSVVVVVVMVKYPWVIQFSKVMPRKVRRLYQDKVLAGFAGGTADAFTLFERFESKLEAHSGNLMRASVELAKDWRTDRMLRRLEAMLIVADTEHSLIVSGTGDVIEPENDILAIGSGGSYARASAQALLTETSLEAEAIVRRSLLIAGEICVYTNDRLVLESLSIGK